MNAMTYKGYSGVFSFEPDDDAFHGQVVGIKDVVHFTGRSVDELRQSFQESVDDYLALCQEIGKQPEKPYSGKFVVRLAPEVHKMAETAAKATGQTLNAFSAKAIESAAKETMRGKF